MKINLKQKYDPRTAKAMKTWLHVLRSYKLINQKETSFISKYSLTKNQFEVLEALYHMGDLRVGELTKLIMSTPGNITVVLKNLKKDNFIDILQNESDKRAFIVTITKNGEDKISSMFEDHSQNIRACFENFNDDELNLMFSMLRKLYKYNKN